MSSKAGKFIIAGSLVVLGACAPQKSSKFDGANKEAEKPTESSNAVVDINSPDPIIPTKIDNRSIEQVLCEEGPKVVGAAKKADFSQEFKLICNGSATTPIFKEAIAQAYTGTGVPAVKILNVQSDEIYVTDLTLVYAIKVPLENPTIFAGLKPHNIFAAGIINENSKLFIDVESRQEFPGGRGNVEQIVLKYDLKLATGASIYDKRRTEFNTYLLVENNRDIALSTEHLLDAATNDYYHKAQGFTIGIKAENGQSYLVFVTNLVVKNRIEPARIVTTLGKLNTAVAKMLVQHITKTPLK
jgi:hypothetical protein